MIVNTIARRDLKNKSLQELKDLPNDFFYQKTTIVESFHYPTAYGGLSFSPREEIVWSMEESCYLAEKIRNLANKCG